MSFLRPFQERVPEGNDREFENHRQIFNLASTARRSEAVSSYRSGYFLIWIPYLGHGLCDPMARVLAPRFNSSPVILGNPTYRCKTVRPRESTSPTQAPASRSIEKVFSFPILAATCKGVSPSRDFELTRNSCFGKKIERLEAIVADLCRTFWFFCRHQ